MSWRASQYVAAGALAAGMLVWAAHEAWPSREIPVALPIVVTSAYDEWSDALGRREILSDVLARAGITGREYVSFMKATHVLNPRRMQPGLVFEMRRLKGAAVANRLGVRLDPEKHLVMSRLGGDSGWMETVEDIPWTTERLRTTAVIQSNLYDALDAAIPDSFLPLRQRVALAWAIADVYDWEVDFTRDMRPGDRVEVLIERLQSPQGEKRFGRVLAARVDVAGSPTFAFAFDGPGGQGSFYDDRGRSLRRAFLRAPLRFSHISSRFGGRFHPILRRWRTHQGTDYAAAYGTPVRATADGIVTEAGRNGGYGNLIEIRHANGIRTRYGHLSKFAKGMHVGQHISQEQTIGYVGSTGLSTGPHLHYEFLVNGRPTNPQRKDAGAGEPVPSKLRSAFDNLRAQLLAELEPTGLPAAAPALGAAAAARDD
ncbi:MAG TPA: M23 family metallopeptidase [Gemmatimonadales bacterium]|jgi:murein DD-endopeptidase MepM/ murein hydrolase activator NlpD